MLEVNIPHASINLAILDPPYYKVVKDSWDNQWLNLQEYLAWSAEYLKHIYPTLTDNASLYIWGSVGKKSDTIIHLKLMIDEYLVFQDWITWSKSRGMGNRKGWVYTREELLWYTVHPTEYVWNIDAQYSTERRKRDGGKDIIRVSQNGYKARSIYKRYTNVWNDISENSYDVIHKKSHTTSKPSKAIERIILAHTKENDIVFDPFLGSGTTAEVCVRHNRRCIGIEKDKNIFAETVIRLEKLINV